MGVVGCQPIDALVKPIGGGLVALVLFEAGEVDQGFEAVGLEVEGFGEVGFGDRGLVLGLMDLAEEQMDFGLEGVGLELLGAELFGDREVAAIGGLAGFEEIIVGRGRSGLGRWR